MEIFPPGNYFFLPTMPELEFAPFDEAPVTVCHSRAFTDLTLVKDAQAAPLIPAFH
jgi:hypothetical protein